MGCKELDITSYYRLTEPSEKPHSGENFCTSKTANSRLNPVVPVSRPNHRYYSPELGRWLSRDPINEQGHFLNKYNDIKNFFLVSLIIRANWLRNRINSLSDNMTDQNTTELLELHSEWKRVKYEINKLLPPLQTINGKDINLYALCLNDPIANIDILGLKLCAEDCEAFRLDVASDEGWLTFIAVASGATEGISGVLAGLVAGTLNPTAGVVVGSLVVIHGIISTAEDLGQINAQAASALKLYLKCLEMTTGAAPKPGESVKNE